MTFDTRKLVFIIMCLIIFIYVRFFTSVATSMKIVQLPLIDLTPSVLMQKNPIIIDERIVNPMHLLHANFKYLYIYKKIKTFEENNIYKQNTSRFFIICSKVDDNIVDIVHPKFWNGDEPHFIEIRLHANMCMVLPYKWWYRFRDGKEILSISLEDTLSLTLGRLL